MGKLENVTKDIRILVVDDYALTRAMVQSILKSVGFSHVTQAENGTMAMRKLDEENIQLVICDWNMPEYNGLEVLKYARTIERYKDLPFIMLTAEAYRKNVLEATQAGVTAYIIKPFTADVLIQKLAEVLEKDTSGQ